MTIDDLIRPRWQAQAACRTEPRTRFFPGPGDSATFAAAVAICQRCPVRAECLEFALKFEEKESTARFGVWGGMSARSRGRMLRSSKAAA